MIYVQMLRTRLADGGGKVSSGGIIICFEVYGALRMVKFTRGDKDWDSGNAVVAKGPSFYFSSRSHYVEKGDAFSEDSSIRWRCWKSCIGRGMDA